MKEGIPNGLTGIKNKNVFRYISKWGFGVYNWKLDDERKSLAWISVAKVNDVLRSKVCEQGDSCAHALFERVFTNAHSGPI